LKPEELQNFSQSLFAFLYFKFLERDGNRVLWPTSIILIGLDWIREPLSLDVGLERLCHESKPVTVIDVSGICKHFHIDAKNFKKENFFLMCIALHTDLGFKRKYFSKIVLL